jgi:hypothetical protein
VKETISVMEKGGFRETTTREPRFPPKHLHSPNFDNPAGRHQLKNFAKWTREELIAHLMFYWLASEAQGVRLREAEPRLHTAEREAMQLRTETEELGAKLEAEKEISRQRFRETQDAEALVRERDAAIVKLALQLVKGTP